ncbi:hypothetical protein A9Q84_00340 [Halobacteriovorax marinus]|uniref:Glutamate synthase domain-containing protein n=1 Tax=Halobacteriovorax marinus TaxID=97084 RepID=A0A1Y5FBC9_9BACT|nr:hypothetical protein A9Q84_00340 [Halobacteriovorax marinus]
MKANIVLLISLFILSSCSHVSNYKSRTPASDGISIVNINGCSSALMSFLKAAKKFELSKASSLVKSLHALADSDIVSTELRGQIESVLSVNLIYKSEMNRKYADLTAEFLASSGEQKKALKNKLKNLGLKMENFSPKKDVLDILDSYKSLNLMRKSDFDYTLSTEALDALERENEYLIKGLHLPDTYEGNFIGALYKINKQSSNLTEDTLEELEKKLLATDSAKLAVDQAGDIFARTKSDKAATNYLSAAFNINPKYLYAKTKYKLQLGFATKVFRPTLDFFRNTLEHGGLMFRKYFSKQAPGRELQRWSFVEKLHELGKISGSFGHDYFKGWVDILGAQGVSDKAIAKIHKDTKLVGRDIILPSGKVVKIKKMEASAMMNISGMSFPQLSAESHITLLATQAELTASKGVKMTVNTGEGGPMFHLALIDGDVEKLRREVIFWGLETGDFKVGSMDYHEINVRIEEIMKLRDEVLTKENVKGSKIVAQFGTALNGIRSNDGFAVDFDKLKEIGDHPSVAMIQFKLDQAAKRGSKVDINKVDAITAAMRKINKNKGIQSPKSIDEYTHEELAKLITATKIVTKKPVSLKIAPGDLNFALERIKYLRDHNALPDHIQVDGVGTHFSGGSGNAPQGAGVSMTTQHAVISMDAILKKLGVRNQVHLEASGGVIYPQDAVEMMVLGADDVSSARFWMGSALGCGRVQQCANGACPYGIAAKNSIFAKGLDPKARSEKAIKAADAWHNFYVDKIGEMGVSDWRTIRETHGLHVNDPKILQRIKKRDANGEQIFLKSYYRPYLYELLSPIMTKEEVDHFVLGSAAN